MKPARIVVACLVALLTALAAPAQETRLMASLKAITAGADSAERRDAIAARLEAFGVRPVFQPFGEGRAAGANLVVTFLGGGVKTMVVGAHLDRVSAGRGAVDNGASCAALIELAAAIKASPITRTTLQIVFFDREEVGLVGSRAFFAAADRRPDYAINMDIFAYGDTIFATGSHPDGVLLRSLKEVGEASGLPVRDVPRNRYPNSDHVTMMNAGIETLGLALIDAADVDGVLGMGAKGGRPRILTIIHTPNDTLDEVRPLQVERGITLVERLIRTVDRAE